MNTLEAPRVKMQLVKNGDSIMLDMQPTVNEDQNQLIRGVLSGHGVPADTLLFRDVTPRGTEPFTEINCTAARLEAEKSDHFFDERNFAREVWDILFQHGNIVELGSTEVVPIERSHRLLGLS